MTKVLSCIHSLEGGGAERQLTEMLRYSASRDLIVYIFCVNPGQVELGEFADRVFVLTDPKKYPFGLIGEIAKVVGKVKPDLVHCWLPVPVIFPAMIVAKWRKIPVVASYRVRKRFITVYEWIEYFATRFMADTIVSNNPPEQSNKAFRKLFAKKRGVYIPNSVSVDIEQDKNSKLRGPNEPFKILFVGRIDDEQKNWRNLIAAVDGVGREKNFRLLICGAGKEEEQLKAEVLRLGLENTVEMLGYRSDIYAIMRSADVLVLPSWYEGMPNVVVEAMALRLPTIVSRVPAHTLLFGDDAGVTYIDPADPSSITRTLVGFIEQRIDQEPLINAAYEFTKTLTPDKLLQRYENLYRRTIDEFRAKSNL